MLYQIEVYSTGIKVFDSLPQRINNVHDNHKQFKSTLKINYKLIDKYFNVSRE